MKLSICFILSLITILMPIAIYAQPPVAAFFGTVKVEGMAVPDNTKISAWIEGEKVAETTTKDSKYFLTITQPADKSFADKKISFQVGGYFAQESGFWKAGEVFKLDLNVVITTPVVAFFKGMVRVNNDTVVDGTKVEAWIEGEKVAETDTVGSAYFLKVEQPKGKFFEDKPISFKVMGLDARPSSIWRAGAESTLDLIAFTPPSLFALFTGSVKVEGGDVPDGTIVSAWLGGQKVAQATTVNSRYVLKVIQPPDRNYQGKEVRFKIGELEGEQAGTWLANATINLDLSAKFNALISLRPLIRNVYPGRLFTVEVNINPKGDGLSSAEVELAFSPEIMEVVKVSGGEILGAKPVEAKKVDNERGRLIYALARVGATSPPTPQGAFAFIQFEVKKDAQAGEYPVTVLKASLSDENFARITNIGLSSASIKVMATIAGDINGDGRVDYQDLAQLSVAYGKSRGESGYRAEVDLNDDGVIDYKDLAILGANYGLAR